MSCDLASRKLAFVRISYCHRVHLYTCFSHLFLLRFVLLQVSVFIRSSIGIQSNIFWGTVLYLCTYG